MFECFGMQNLEVSQNLEFMILESQNLEVSKKNLNPQFWKAKIVKSAKFLN